MGNEIEVRVSAPTPQAMSIGSAYVDTANAVTIDGQEMLSFAADTLTEIKDQYKALEAKRTAGKAPLLEATRNWDGLFKPALEALAEAERILKGKMTAFITEQQRIAAEKQRIADEAARKERERIAREAAAAQAEAARKQREADERARELQREADQLAQAAREVPEMADEFKARAAERAEQADTIAEVAATETADLFAKAESAAFEAAMVVAPAVQTVAVPKGSSLRVTWSAEVTDIRALARAVADGKVPATLLTADMKALNKMASALGAQLDIPGVKPVSTTSLAQRGSK